MRRIQSSWPFGTVCLLSVIFLVGCQTFRPVGVDELGRGDRVRVDLRETTDVELRQMTARDVNFVDGETVARTDTELTLSAFSLRRPDGGVVPAEGWTVHLPLDLVEGIQERRLAVWRTVGLVAGVAAATLFGWEALGGGGEEGENGNGGSVEQ